jgi:dTDP-glucose 4,6-dehydratase
MLQAARDLNISKIIHTSTSEVYGTARFVPITEEHPLQGQSPYSATKIGADQLALSFAASFDMPVAIVRPFNTYGPRQSARAVIPTVITQIANNAKKIKLGALHPTRDFNYVLDTVSGFIAALESDKSIGEVINIGSNFEVSIGDTVKYIAELMHVDVDIFSEQERMRPENSEVERLWASNKKAQELLNWSPQYAGVSGFKRGLQKTIDWFSDPNNLKMYKSDRYVV